MFNVRPKFDYTVVDPHFYHSPVPSVTVTSELDACALTFQLPIDYSRLYHTYIEVFLECLPGKSVIEEKGGTRQIDYTYGIEKS